MPRLLRAASILKENARCSLVKCTWLCRPCSVTCSDIYSGFGLLYLFKYILKKISSIVESVQTLQEMLKNALPISMMCLKIRSGVSSEKGGMPVRNS